MAKRGKKYKQVNSKRITEVVSVKDAISNVKKSSYSKFDGTVELHVTTILPKEKDPKSIKGSVSLPNMSSETSVRVAVAVSESFETKAKEAGADVSKFSDLEKMIKDGKLEFDVLLATPDMMAKLAVHGKALGPKGLMPNPKNGTVVTPDTLEAVVSEFKKGKLVFKADSSGGIHVPVGKVSMEDKKLQENIDAMLTAIAITLGKSREACIRKAILAPTMGTSVSFDFKLTE